MAVCRQDVHWGDDSDAVLVIFCSYRYSKNIFEAVDKRLFKKKKRRED